MANETDRKSAVKNAMSRAAKLMQLESNGTLDKIANDPTFRNNINSTLNSSESINTKELMSTNVPKASDMPLSSRQMPSSSSKVPKAIMEAFMSNPIDDSALYSAMGNGDGRDISFLMEGTNETPTQIVKPTQNVREIINEGLESNRQQYVPSSQQIDYPMIRTIVEEIVRKYAVSLNKKILSEGKQNANEISTIALGKTFKFLDKEGNIYECTTKKIGNINQKKKNTI
jgi:hypothetical protein